LRGFKGFGLAQHTLLRSLPTARQRERRGSQVWATACYAHHISETNLFWELPNAASVTQAAALAAALRRLTERHRDGGPRLGRGGHGGQQLAAAWLDELPAAFPAQVCADLVA
jgi:uncharacterized protein (UPF0261 family)